MITNEVIDEIYKKYDKKPSHYSEIDLPLLFEKAGIDHDILIDPETEEMSIGSIEEDSPFHKFPLRNIHAIVPFEQWTAIVMHSSILFLNNKRPQVSIHIKATTMSLLDRLRSTFKMIV